MSFLPLFYVGIRSLCSVSMVLSLVHALLLLCLSAYESFSSIFFFLSDSLSTPFCPFLVSGLALVFFFSLLSRSDLGSFATGSPFAPSPPLRVVPSPPSPVLSVSLSAPTMFSVSYGHFCSSSFLVFCEWYAHLCGFYSGCRSLFSSWGCSFMFMFYYCLHFFFFT